MTMKANVPFTLLLVAIVVRVATLGAQSVSTGGIGLVDAVRQSLDLQPDIQTQVQQVRISLADLQAAAGQFDMRLTAGLDQLRDQRPNTAIEQAQRETDSLITNQTSYSLSFQKQMRNGLTLFPSAQVIRSNNNLLPLPANRVAVSLTAVQPLQRGRGTEVVTAVIRATQSAVRASEQDLRQVRSTSALRTIAAYWNYVAAQKRLVIYQESEMRSQQLVDQIRTLIDAGNRPAADIKQLQATLSDRRTTRISGEQAVVDTRQQLGLAMGLDADQIGALPRPLDDFPGVPADDLPLSAAALEDLAVSRRADLAAIREREQQADTLITAARDQLKPQLNLQLSGGYAGLNEGANLLKLLMPFQRQVAGLNGEITMHYEWAGANHAALGAFERIDAARRQTGIARVDLTRNIRSSVEVAWSALRSSAARVRSQRDSGALYRAAIDDEREKQQLGLSTVIDLIVTEDRLTNSLLSVLAAELSYAVAVAQLRFQTDTLVPATGSSIDYESLTTVVPVVGK